MVYVVSKYIASHVNANIGDNFRFIHQKYIFLSPLNKKDINNAKVEN